MLRYSTWGFITLFLPDPVHMLLKIYITLLNKDWSMIFIQYTDRKRYDEHKLNRVGNLIGPLAVFLGGEMIITSPPVWLGACASILIREILKSKLKLAVECSASLSLWNVWKLLTSPVVGWGSFFYSAPEILKIPFCALGNTYKNIFRYSLHFLCPYFPKSC